LAASMPRDFVLQARCRSREPPSRSCPLGGAKRRHGRDARGQIEKAFLQKTLREAPGSRLRCALRGTTLAIRQRRGRRNQGMTIMRKSIVLVAFLAIAGTLASSADPHKVSAKSDAEILAIVMAIDEHEIHAA